MIEAQQKQHAFAQLREVKSAFAAKGWFPATSGNLSIRTSDIVDERFHFAITASGKDKSVHTDEDYLIVDEQGSPVESTTLKPSAETLIHCEIYRLTQCGAIFHVHTIYNNVMSEYFAQQKQMNIKGVELIKGLNIWEEDAEIQIPILRNYAHIPSIVENIQSSIIPSVPAILLQNHGIYAWGANAFEAKRHIEAFEFLFEHQYHWQLLND